MQKHRKKKHYRKISIAAVALGIVAVPTAAIACWDTQETGATRASERQGSRPYSPSASAPTLPLETQADPVAAPNGAPEPAEQPTVEPQSAEPPAATTQPPAAPQPAKPAPAKPKPPATPKQPSTPPSAAPSGPTAEVVALVNKERAKAGCSALTVNAKLTAAALNHSKDMAAHSTMSHTGSDGSDAGERITRAGYAWMTYGENVAYGYSTPEQVMTGWMNSPGHRQNILNCAFKEIGVGLAQPNSYWTQNFGAAR